MSTTSDDPINNGHWVYSPYITVKGKRIYRKGGGVFKFWVDN